LSRRKPVPLRKRALFGMLAAAVVLAILLAPWVVWRSRQPKVPVHFKVDRKIATDVGIGTDKQQVIDYCIHRGWEYSGRGSTGDEKIVATDRAVPDLQILRTDVLMTFEFDRAGKLLAFHSEDRYTGP
jgi:hypothetical protein